jgi:hypothetical protein
VGKFADQIRLPRTSIDNYIRVARAFPIEKRIPNLSFTHHYLASFADSYSEKQNKFLTNTRFKWVEKAADNSLSTRQLLAQINEYKDKRTLKPGVAECRFCMKPTGTTMEYIFYSPGSRTPAEKMKLHRNCYPDVINLIYTYYQKKGKQKLAVL